MKKFAVVVSGCGHLDGAEIQETLMTMLAIERSNCDYELFAPDRDQYHVINHLTMEEMPGKRNMLVEAARIARGRIKDVSNLDIQHFDAIVFPGGFGVAKNFFTYAFDGVKADVLPEIAKIIKEAHAAGKPIGALCISPVLIAKVLGDVTVTIGQDEATSDDIIDMGGNHVNAIQTDVVSDRKNKIFSTPCYMLEASVEDIAEGAENLIETMLMDM